MAGYITSSESQLDYDDHQGAQWAGAGAEAIGLEDGASTEAIEKILSGELPVLADGTFPELVGANDPDRRNGTEFIISAPKSVSIMAVTYGDKRLIDAHLRAEKQVMAYAEKEAAQARVKEKGAVRIEKTGNLVYARSTHGYDDAGKPHLHSHVAIANLTQTSDGKWRALDNSALWANSAKYGANYLRLMADEVRKLGYQIELHKNGKGWDIVDVPKDVIAANASRGVDIKAAAAAFGSNGYGANRVARFETRENIGKDIPASDLNARNQSDDRTAGFEGESVKASAEKRVAEPAGVLGAIRQTATQVYRDVLERLDTRSEVKLTSSPYLPASIRSVTQSPAMARAYISMAHAIHHNEQREAAFLERTVVRDALNLQQPGVTIEMLDKILDEHKSAGVIVEGKTANPNNLMITTKASLEREQAIIDNVLAAWGTSTPHVAGADVADALREHLRSDADGKPNTLNGGQLGAAKLILSSSDGIVLVQGFSGTGKTATIGPVAAHEAAQGRAIFGLAPSKTAVEELASVGLASNTITSFLNENRDALLGEKAAIATGREKYAGATLIVDESSMIGNRDFQALTDLHSVLGLNKTVFVGDKRQLQAVDQGKAFEIVQTIPIARAEIRDVVRQRDPSLKAYNEAIRVGDIAGAFEAIRDNVHQVEIGYLEAAADHYLRLSPEAQNSTLLITAGNADRHRADQYVQSALREQGVLQGEGHRLTIYDDKGLTDAEMRRAERYAPDDVLRVAKCSQNLNLRRGDYRVESVSGNTVRFIGEDGSAHRIDVRHYQGQAANEAAKLLEPRQIEIYAGDKVRWTSNDNARGLINNQRAEVTEISAEGIAFKLANGQELSLASDDPQLKKLDLAYAVNAHKVQGASAPMALWATPSDHKMLTTLRQAYVNGTRAIHQMHVYTDNVAKLQSMLGSTPSDKLSALEITGALDGLRNQAFAEELNANLAVGRDDTHPASAIEPDTLDKEMLHALDAVLSAQSEEDYGPISAEQHNEDMLQTSLWEIEGIGTDKIVPTIRTEALSLSIAHMVPILIDQNAEVGGFVPAVATNATDLATSADALSKGQNVSSLEALDPASPERIPMPEIRKDYDIS